MIVINEVQLAKVLNTTPAEQNIMLAGKAGIGKSEILTKYFTEKGMRVVTLFLGQMADPGDLIGLPNKDIETGKTEFLPPYWWPTDGQPIVLFLDELNRARPELLQAVMDLSLNRKLAGRVLPEGSRIISAVNDGEEYQVNELDPALVSRFNIYTFRPSVEGWLEWAAKAGVDERVRGFISDSPSLLDGGTTSSGDLDSGLEKRPDRRAWKKVSDLLRPIADDEIDDDLHKIVGGIVGLQATNLFWRFLSEDNLLSPKKIFFEYSKKLEKKILSLQIHEETALLERVLNSLENGEDFGGDKGLKNIEKFLLVSIDETSPWGLETGHFFINLVISGKFKKTSAMIKKDLKEVWKKILEVSKM